jgi:hypothetical protein
VKYHKLNLKKNEAGKKTEKDRHLSFRHTKNDLLTLFKHTNDSVFSESVKIGADRNEHLKKQLHFHFGIHNSKVTSAFPPKTPKKGEIKKQISVLSQARAIGIGILIIINPFSYLSLSSFFFPLSSFLLPFNYLTILLFHSFLRKCIEKK